jgi:hypothetical protein
MPRVDTRFPLLRARRQRETLDALGELLTDQRDDVAARWESGASVLLTRRWDALLQEVVFDQNKLTASEVAWRVAKAFEAEFDPSVMTGWLEENARVAAERVNQSTRDRMADSKEDDPVGHVFGILLTSGVAMYARSMVTSAANFGAGDAAKASGAALKMWQTNSSNPRSSHSAMGGETVPIGEMFSNGMQWPGDSMGGADEVANCQCSMTIL